jgi:hypothetical protein
MLQHPLRLGGELARLGIESGLGPRRDPRADGNATDGERGIALRPGGEPGQVMREARGDGRRPAVPCANHGRDHAQLCGQRVIRKAEDRASAPEIGGSHLASARRALGLLVELARDAGRDGLPRMTAQVSLKKPSMMSLGRIRELPRSRACRWLPAPLRLSRKMRVVLRPGQRCAER